MQVYRYGTVQYRSKKIYLGEDKPKNLRVFLKLPPGQRKYISEKINQQSPRLKATSCQRKYISEKTNQKSPRLKVTSCQRKYMSEKTILKISASQSYLLSKKIYLGEDKPTISAS
jgi:hypothetical protein